MSFILPYLKSNNFIFYIKVFMLSSFFLYVKHFFDEKCKVYGNKVYIILLL